MKQLTLRIIIFSLLLMIAVQPVISESSYIMDEDLTGELVFPYDDVGLCRYVYSYRYPHVLGDDECSAVINGFYQYEISDTEEYRAPMNADYYRSTGIDAYTQIDYEIKCNNEDYFSILLRSCETAGADTRVVYTGHTFSRTDSKPGSTISLPYLLGILKSDENDTWLQDRQTEKANSLIRELMLEKLSDMRSGIIEHPFDDIDLDEILEYAFFPEEDFFLDENGDPVFFLEPGIIDNEDSSLITVPIPMEVILDEL